MIYNSHRSKEKFMDIKLVKLVTGEELVTGLEIEGDTYKLKDAARIMLSQEGGVGMMPLCPFGKEGTVEVNVRHVVYVTDPEIEIQNAYNGKFGSGIEIATTADLRIVSPD
jgi:hypothetical protein